MRSNPTDAERRLWSILRAKRLAGFKFRRQAIIESYIVDLACFPERLIIEADGSQHADDRNDARRDAFLGREGFRLLRFWDNQVLAESEAVAAAIHDVLLAPSPFAASGGSSLSRKGRGIFGASHA